MGANRNSQKEARTAHWLTIIAEILVIVYTITEMLLHWLPWAFSRP